MNPELLACTYTGFIIWNLIIYMAEYKEKHNRSTLMCQDLIKKKKKKDTVNAEMSLKPFVLVWLCAHF